MSARFPIRSGKDASAVHRGHPDTTQPGPGPTRGNLGRWLLGGVLGLWNRALRERSSPREIGLSVALGAFAGCSPFVGFHLGIAFALATLLRLNRLWAMVGSRVSSTPIFLATTFCEIEIAHLARTGQFTPLQWEGGLARAKELYGDWLLGMVLFGAPLALAVGAAAFFLAKRWPNIPAGAGDAAEPEAPKASEVVSSRRTLEELRPPS